MIRPASFLVFLALAPAVHADPAIEARERLLAAASLLEAAESAGDRVGALTDAVRAYEAGLQAMRAEQRRLMLEERHLEAALADEDGDISSLLALMQNATAQTETQSLLHPGTAVDSIRAGTLASALTPQLFSRAAELEGRLSELDDLQVLIAAAEASVEEGLSGVTQARRALGEALTDRTELPPRLATNTAAMEALINSAETLSALADSLVSAESVFQTTAPAPWQPPFAGLIVADFSPEAGRTGWAVATAPEALLTSPTDVTVRFSTEFPDRDTVVILEADGQLLVLMAGLSRSFVTRGQVLRAGDPVGLAGQGQSAAQDNLNDSGANDSLSRDETVYIELRQGGIPVDPATRLTLEQEQG